MQQPLAGNREQLAPWLQLADPVELLKLLISSSSLSKRQEVKKAAVQHLVTKNTALHCTTHLLPSNIFFLIKCILPVDAAR